MRSITEQSDLDEFLATAELAGTDFTAEKMNNVKIIHMDQRNPYLLSAAEEAVVLDRQKKYKGQLTVPRRPHWDSSTTPQELDRQEKEAFFNWRRGLASLQENNDLLMTPFERNIEVWRQLWRVIERSDLVVQIVDGRNPLLFRSEDLEAYVKDVDARKQNLLLINKADLLTHGQRQAWAKYLREAGIAFRFFSAHLAKESNEMADFDSESEDADGEAEADEQAGEHAAAAAEGGEEESEDEELKGEFDDEDEIEEKVVSGDEHDDTRIMTVEELEALFLEHAPRDTEGTATSKPYTWVSPNSISDPDRKLQVGLVGYPNVGKSSTINALIGAKKVSVSSTPGKTKHFQTIHLSDKVVLCDCPGLVFPNFATTKADLVCNGVLPIDQLREYLGPVGLVLRRIPQPILEAIYSIQIRSKSKADGGTGEVTAEDLLAAFARGRGFALQSKQGVPDYSRAARIILKDYVNAKLLYCEPPPGLDPFEFNRDVYDDERLGVARRMEELSLSGNGESSSAGPSAAASSQAAAKLTKMDRDFFKPAASKSMGHLKQPFNHKYSIRGQEYQQMSARKARALIAIENGVDPEDVQLVSGKKHFKGGPKRGKKKGKGKGDLSDDP